MNKAESLPRALVTGGARRIGRAIAEKLAAAGWQVIAHYNRAETEAAELLAWAKKNHARISCLRADLAKPEEIARLIPEAVEKFGPLSLLVNNASLFELDRIETLDFASFQTHQTVNLYAPALLSRHFAETTQAEDPLIVNILDQKVENLNPDYLSYTLAKCGLYELTKILAYQWAGKVRVCGIAPGLTMISTRQTQTGFERAWKATPSGRSSTPDEIAETVLYLSKMRGITGETIFIDGGEHLGKRRRDVAFDIS